MSGFKLLRWVASDPRLKKGYRFIRTFSFFAFDGIPVWDVMAFFIEEIQKDALANRAKAIGFSFFLAIIPAIIFLFTLIPYIPVTGFQQDLFELISQIMPNEAAFKMIENTVRDILVNQRGGLLSTGAILTLYFSSNGVAAMLDSFDKSYSIYKQRNFFQKQFIAFKITLLLTVLLIFSITLIILGGSLLSMAMDALGIRDGLIAFALNALRYLVIFTLFLFSISLIYYFGSGAKEDWRFISTGSTFATILSILISAGFSYYVQNFARYNEFYGSLGTIAMLLIWLYMNSYAIVIGFELNAAIYYNKTFKTSEKD